MRKLKSPLAAATLKTSVVYATRLIVQAGVLVLVSRMLGPSQYGAFASILALGALLATLAPFGMPLVLLSEIAPDPGRYLRTMSYAVPVTLISGTLLLLIFLGMASSMLGLLPEIGFSDLLVLGIAEFIVQPFVLFPAVWHQARDRVAFSQLMNTLHLVLRCLALLVIVALDIDNKISVYLYCCLASSVMILACASSTLEHAWPSVRQWRLPNRDEAKKAAGFACLYATSTGPSELDKVLVIRVLPLELSGVYSAASRILGAFLLPVLAMMMSALPKMFRMSEKRSEGAPVFLRALFIASLLYGLMAAGVIWLCAPLFEMVFGRQYAGIADVVRTLCFLSPVMALRFSGNTALTAVKNPWVRVWAEGGSLAIMVIGILCLPLEGVPRMFAALLLSEAVSATLSWSLALKAARSYAAVKTG